MSKIFLFDDKTPIKFHVSNGRDAQRVKFLILRDGGLISVAADADFRLEFGGELHTASTLTSPVVKFTWVTDCLEEGSKLPIYPYLCNPNGLAKLDEAQRDRAELLQEELTNGITRGTFNALHRRLPHLTSDEWKELHAANVESNKPLIEETTKLLAPIQAELAKFRAVMAKTTLSVLLENLSTRLHDESPPSTIIHQSLGPTPEGNANVMENLVGTAAPIHQNGGENQEPSTPPGLEREESTPAMDFIEYSTATHDNEASVPPSQGSRDPLSTYTKPARKLVRTTEKDIEAMVKFSLENGLVEADTVKIPSLVQRREFIAWHDKESRRTDSAWKGAWYERRDEIARRAKKYL